MNIVLDFVKEKLLNNKLFSYLGLEGCLLIFFRVLIGFFIMWMIYRVLKKK